MKASHGSQAKGSIQQYLVENSLYVSSLARLIVRGAEPDNPGICDGTRLGPTWSPASGCRRMRDGRADCTAWVWASFNHLKRKAAFGEQGLDIDRLDFIHHFRNVSLGCDKKCFSVSKWNDGGANIEFCPTPAGPRTTSKHRLGARAPYQIAFGRNGALVPRLGSSVFRSALVTRQPNRLGSFVELGARWISGTRRACRQGPVGRLEKRDI
jgi:hypothetical protein